MLEACHSLCRTHYIHWLELDVCWTCRLHLSVNGRKSAVSLLGRGEVRIEQLVSSLGRHGLIFFHQPCSVFMIIRVLDHLAVLVGDNSDATLAVDLNVGG